MKNLLLMKSDKDQGGYFMKLFESIDGLLTGTKYLAWGIALLGIPLSVILLFTNFSMGFAAVMVCIAALLLAVGVTLTMLPEKLAKGKLAGKMRFIVGGVAIVLAVAVMGIAFFTTGGFPALNLIFC